MARRRGGGALLAGRPEHPAVVEALLAGIHLRRRLLESLAKGLSAGNPGRDIWKLREDWVPLKNDLLQATRRMLVQLGSLAKDWQTPFHVSVEEVDALLQHQFCCCHLLCAAIGGVLVMFRQC